MGAVMAGQETPPFDKVLDARGKSCPLPVLQASLALSRLGLGQILKVTTTDRGSVNDFQAFARQSGADLLTWLESADEYTFYLKKVRA